MGKNIIIIIIITNYLTFFFFSVVENSRKMNADTAFTCPNIGCRSLVFSVEVSFFVFFLFSKESYIYIFATFLFWSKSNKVFYPFPSRSRTNRQNLLKFLFSHFSVVPQKVL